MNRAKGPSRNPVPATGDEALSIVSPGPEKVDPQGLLNALMATGATEREARREVFRSGDPLCREFLVDWGSRRLTKALSVDAALQEIACKAEFENGSAHQTVFDQLRGIDHELAIRAALRSGISPVCRGSLDLSGTDLAVLPENMVVQGPLILSGCEALKTLPAGLQVKKYLVLAGCRNLEVLPDDLQVAEGIDLENCSALKCLPKTMRVEGSLDLTGCSSLPALPEGLAVTGSCSLKACTALKALPGGMCIGEDLIVVGLPHLSALPKDLKVEGGLEIGECPKLKQVSKFEDGCKIRAMQIVDCASFLKLPDGIEVEDGMAIRGCPAFRSLPASFGADWLSITECPQWDGIIPEDAMIKVNVYTDEYPYCVETETNEDGGEVVVLDDCGNEVEPDDSGIPFARWRTLYGSTSCYAKRERDALLLEIADLKARLEIGG